jgi:hypothetical protein
MPEMSIRRERRFWARRLMARVGRAWRTGHAPGGPGARPLRGNAGCARCAFASLGRPLRGNAGCARCAFASLGRPLRGNAGCARCAFAWAAPALGSLRCNPGYSRNKDGL